MPEKLNIGYSERYKESEKMLSRSLDSIPCGTQTVAKGAHLYPYGASPFFVERALGSEVWDVDGNKYIDFISSLATVILGHCDADVVRAVKNQLDDGVGFSLPHPLEHQVAELIIDMVPCAEKVRFMKNAADSTAAAIRLARAYTGRDHVAMCGYHGWQDWCIAPSSHNLGIPDATRALTHSFKFNNIESLHKIFKEHSGQVAAIIMEPMNIEAPNDGFLEEVKELAQKEGCVLVFDETITGFRFSNGGAQELFGVTPDLACFGKALSNGFPLSALAGKAEIMGFYESAFISTTHGGETLSLAAAKATLEKLRREPIVERVNQRGVQAYDGLKELISQCDVSDFVSICGHPTYFFLIFSDTARYSKLQLQSLFLQEILSNGILAFDKHWVNSAHSQSDINELLRVYAEAFAVVRDADHNSNLENLMNGLVIEPAFVFK